MMNQTTLFSRLCASLILLGLLLVSAPAEAAPRFRLRVLEPSAEPLRLLGSSEGGQVVRFARGSRAFRFDVRSGKLTVGAKQTEAGTNQLQAQPNLVVTTATDGSLRWRSQKAETFRLAFYLSADDKHWILFSPSGYYARDDAAGSKKGDEYVGFVAADQPDQSYPLRHFARYYQRPEVVRAVLAYEDGEAGALHAANLRQPRARPVPELQRLLPPEIKIESPTDNAAATDRSVSIDVSLRSPSGEPIAAVEAWVEDLRTQIEPVEKRDVKIEGTPLGGWERRSYRVRIPAEKCRLTLRAKTADGQSDPATLNLRWTGTNAGPPPKLEVLVVGVGDYAGSGQRSLPQAPQDARAVAAALKKQRGQRYGEVVVTELIDKGATKQSILDALRALAVGKRDPDDVVVVFLAGHGTGALEEGRYYFLPHGSDLSRPEDTLIESREVQVLLADVTGRVLLMLDACNAGGVFSLERGGGALGEQSSARVLRSALSDLPNVVVFAAARASEAALESKRLGSGYFTRALVEGIDGKADLRARGVITVSQLETYVGSRVRELSGGLQTPASAKGGALPDYEVAKVSVPLWRRRAFWPVVGGVLAAGLVGAAVTMGVVIKPDFDRGNSGVFFTK